MGGPDEPFAAGSRDVGWFGRRSAIIKRDRYTATVVNIAYYGDHTARTASEQVLSFRKVPRRPDGDLDFSGPIWSMVFRNEEAQNLLASCASRLPPRPSAPREAGRVRPVPWPRMMRIRPKPSSSKSWAVRTGCLAGGGTSALPGAISLHSVSMTFR
jgi:hypothetical protein